MAERGSRTLAFGPLRPVGFTDPRTGKRPYALLQLRCENKEDTLYNMVGFQTRLTHPEQKRVFSMIPGLSGMEFARYGSMHRNTFIDSPKLLNSTLALKKDEQVFVAGQITGVEGYCESSASGIIAGLNGARVVLGKTPLSPERSTMIGALLGYITDEPKKGAFQPMNANFGILGGYRGKRDSAVARALEEIERFKTKILQV